MKNDEVILEINHLTKEFPLASGETLTACNDINLRVYKGKTLGIIGESGCGKSTLARTLLRINSATSGEVIFEGKNLLNLSREELRQSRKKMQLVFQDPNTAFNPKMLVKNIITEPLINFGLIKKEDVDAKAIELLNLVELPPTFKDKYPHNMSGGQRQRLGIARALSLNPQIVICDEATSALDVSVQKSICELLCKIQKAKNITYIFIAHDLGLVDLMCQQVAVMYLGSVVEIIENGRISTICKHPYTKLLLQSVFDIYKKNSIKMFDCDLKSLRDISRGCPFASRCKYCQEICLQEKPQLREIDEGHWVACHLVK